MTPKRAAAVRTICTVAAAMMGAAAVSLTTETNWKAVVSAALSAGLAAAVGIRRPGDR